MIVVPPRRRRVALKRLAPTLSHLVISLAVLFWLVATMDLFAQLPMPQGGPTQNPAADSAANLPTPEVVPALLAQAKEAMEQNDVKAAITAYRRASGAAGKDVAHRDELASLRTRLLQAGVEKERLTPLAATEGSAISADAPVADRKREALRLIAVGRSALDRGDIAGALALAHKAHSLEVPETEFAPGEPRVWEFVLDAESAARRTGMPRTGDVQPAVGVGAEKDAGTIAQMLFRDAAESTPGESVEQVQAESEGGEGQGERLFREGLDALSADDKALARKKFSEAWKFEDELDLATRAQLQDKLTLLQPSRLPSPADDDSEDATSRPMTALERAEQQGQRETQRLYREVQSELTAANQLKTTEPLEAVDQLERLLRRVEGSQVDDAAKRSMTALVNRALSEQKRYVEANRADIDLQLRNEGIKSQMAIDQAQSERIEEEVTSLVEEFNHLVEQRRYPEAEVVAKQVAELKPDSTIAQSMLMQSRMKTRLLMNQEVRDELEESFVRSMLDVERSAIGDNPDLPLEFDDARVWTDLSNRRLRGDDGSSRLSTREREIKQKLSTQEVEINYQERPLSEVIEELSAVTGTNIVLDSRALSAINVDSNTPVSLKMNNRVLFKSALNIMLDSLDCAYVIENDSLIITSNEAKRSRVYSRVYKVADLVIPIPNFSTSYEDGLAGALRAAYQMASPQADVQVMPVSATDLGTGMAKSMSPASMGPNMLGQYNPQGNAGGNPGGSAGGFGNNPSAGGGRGGAAFADFGSLMQLIETTVVPDTWEALGGPSSMSPYQQNLSLVISTTSDVHDQIADLLDSLRRLQNLQITIEVRFITLSDNFFEQIGVDFDLQFDDGIERLPDEDSGSSVTVGFGADGLPTADFDVRLDNNAFGVTPTFGGFDVQSASTLGFAILSDIEAFFFLQAAQGDSRTNVMQAPKLTLFDGQMASINDTVNRPFVTSITPVVGDFAVAQQPVIVVLNEGTQLNVQGVVSDDKRFVRLTLVPFFSQIGDVDTFTFEGRRSSRRSSRNREDTDGDGEDNIVDDEEEEDVIEGTTVQLPTFAITTISTTVSVPDGGTILLGGIKRLSEGRSERGVPMLSKIPYLSRLFRNVSVGRESSSLMMMVTPRIIIQDEEEIAQTGFDPRR